MSIIEAGGMDVPVKRIWVPVTYGSAMTYCGEFPVCSLTALYDAAFMSFWVPPDFHKIEQVYIVVISQVAGAVSYWAAYTDYGKAGEAYNTHGASAYLTTFTAVIGRLYQQDIKSLLADLAVGDYVGVSLYMFDADEDVDVVGLQFEYD